MRYVFKETPTKYYPFKVTIKKPNKYQAKFETEAGNVYTFNASLSTETWSIPGIPGSIKIKPWYITFSEEGHGYSVSGTGDQGGVLPTIMKIADWLIKAYDCDGLCFSGSGVNSDQRDRGRTISGRQKTYKLFMMILHRDKRFFYTNPLDANHGYFKVLKWAYFLKLLKLKLNIEGEAAVSAWIKTNWNKEPENQSSDQAAWDNLSPSDRIEHCSKLAARVAQETLVAAQSLHLLKANVQIDVSTNHGSASWRSSDRKHAIEVLLKEATDRRGLLVLYMKSPFGTVTEGTPLTIELPFGELRNSTKSQIEGFVRQQLQLWDEQKNRLGPQIDPEDNPDEPAPQTSDSSWDTVCSRFKQEIINLHLRRIRPIQFKRNEAERMIMVLYDTPRELRHPDEYPDQEPSPAMTEFGSEEEAILTIIDEFRARYPDFNFESGGDISGGGYERF